MTVFHGCIVLNFCLKIKKDRLWPILEMNLSQLPAAGRTMAIPVIESLATLPALRFDANEKSPDADCRANHQ
jgi:hypothetical protein